MGEVPAHAPRKRHDLVGKGIRAFFFLVNGQHLHHADTLVRQQPYIPVSLCQRQGRFKLFAHTFSIVRLMADDGKKHMALAQIHITLSRLQKCNKLPDQNIGGHIFSYL